MITINTQTQTMTADLPSLQKTYLISTAKNGTGQVQGSNCTPIGHHIIAQKIGNGMPIGSVFVGRKPTGEIYSDTLAKMHPERDWILTRILWLQGTQLGINQGINDKGICCDSFERYIYIHGTPPSEPMGVPRSHGCVRMIDNDLIELFDCVKIGTPVLII